jgi:hypothetical protein
LCSLLCRVLSVARRHAAGRGRGERTGASWSGCCRRGFSLRACGTEFRPRPSRVWRRRVLIGLGARRTPLCRCREEAFVLIRPVRRPIDSADVSALACCPPRPARSTREEAADVHCGIGPCGVPRPSLADYVRGPEGHLGGDRRRTGLM